MFFILSKSLSFISTPSNLLVLIGLAGISLLPSRFASIGRRLLVVSMVLIVAVGVLPIGTALILPLEERFPPWDSMQGAPAGIIVIGGVISPERSEARGEFSLDEAAERVTTAVELARKYPDTRVVFAGGNANGFAGASEAELAGRFFESLGVSRNRITLETRSRSTAENAVFTKRLIAPKPGERWLLVTSAMHMPRAVGAFRQAGFPVEAYPVDYQTDGWKDLRKISGSLLGNVNKTDAAIHEWLGLLVYWVSGRTPTLFPAP
jgi:uncharacterized SAM-binding protein YcdF (DUF218 family)